MAPSRTGDAAGGGSGKAGAEFWGADPRPAGRERIGASDTRRLKKESNARRSAEKERGRRAERLGDAPPPSLLHPPPFAAWIPSSSSPSSPSFHKTFLLFSLPLPPGFPSFPPFPFFKQRHFFCLNLKTSNSQQQQMHVRGVGGGNGAWKFRCMCEYSRRTKSCC
ncbi:hypothetical protein D4764_10G0007780 [Takifugu flavidus]|uniref:Uncharacterized protein n=1 Tax=Takifugu flavidus TaxID=433684 RepID=A0A5C6PM04_9TELE|nr:hypothetical protein D4764_10G0007780 [Takifugu flavidus]